MLSRTEAPPQGLTGSPPLRGLHRLRLDYVDPASVQHLLLSPLFPALTELTFSGPELAQAVCTALPNAPALPSLRKLDMTGGAVGADLLTALLRASGFALEELSVRGLYAYHGGWGGGYCYWSSGYDSYEEVTPNVGNDGVLALARSPSSTSLRVLDVGYNRLQADAIRALAESPYLEGLQRLRVSELSTDVSAEGWQPLEARFGERLVKG